MRFYQFSSRWCPGQLTVMWHDCGKVLQRKKGDLWSNGWGGRGGVRDRRRVVILCSLIPCGWTPTGASSWQPSKCIERYSSPQNVPVMNWSKKAGPGREAEKFDQVRSNDPLFIHATSVAKLFYGNTFARGTLNALSQQLKNQYSAEIWANGYSTLNIHLPEIPIQLATVSWE